MPRVLLIEDDATMLSLLTTLLKLEGFEVRNLEVGEKTDIIGGVREANPDVLLMDVHLAGERNGVEVLREMRAQDDLKSLAVIMSSGMPLEEDCMRAGATHFLLKPYMPDALIKVIKGSIAAKLQ